MTTVENRPEAAERREKTHLDGDQLDAVNEYLNQQLDWQHLQGRELVDVHRDARRPEMPASWRFDGLSALYVAPTQNGLEVRVELMRGELNQGGTQVPYDRVTIRERTRRVSRTRTTTIDLTTGQLWVGYYEKHAFSKKISGRAVETDPAEALETLAVSLPLGPNGWRDAPQPIIQALVDRQQHAEEK